MKLPRADSPLTGSGSVTNPGFWVNGITWFLSVAAMMFGAKLIGAYIGKSIPALKPWLSDIPLQDTVVMQQRGPSLSTRRVWQ